MDTIISGNLSYNLNFRLVLCYFICFNNFIQFIQKFHFYSKTLVSFKNNIFIQIFYFHSTTIHFAYTGLPKQSRDRMISQPSKIGEKRRTCPVDILKELWNYKQNYFLSATKINGNKTNILNCCFFTINLHFVTSKKITAYRKLNSPLTSSIY